MLIPGPFIGIISQMVTPAVLILAAGSLVNATMLRLARVTDRARALIVEGQTHNVAGRDYECRRVMRMLEELETRSWLAERALIATYVAIAFFLVCCLSIALTDLVHYVVWVPVALALMGGASLFVGTAFLVLEAQHSAGQLRNEIAEYRHDVGARQTP